MTPFGIISQHSKTDGDLMAYRLKWLQNEVLANATWSKQMRDSNRLQSFECDS